MPGADARACRVSPPGPVARTVARMPPTSFFLIKVHAGAIEDLETILDRFLTYGQTTTSFVVSTPVPPRTLPITG